MQAADDKMLGRDTEKVGGLALLGQASLMISFPSKYLIEGGHCMQKWKLWSSELWSFVVLWMYEVMNACFAEPAY